VILRRKWKPLFLTVPQPFTELLPVRHLIAKRLGDAVRAN
jgi:hypothetical protein